MTTVNQGLFKENEGKKRRWKLDLAGRFVGQGGAEQGKCEDTPCGDEVKESPHLVSQLRTPQEIFRTAKLLNELNTVL